MGLEIAEIIMDIEDKYDIIIEEKAAFSLKTIEDIVKYVYGYERERKGITKSIKIYEIEILELFRDRTGMVNCRLDTELKIFG